MSISFEKCLSTNSFLISLPLLVIEYINIEIGYKKKKKMLESNAHDFLEFKWCNMNKKNQSSKMKIKTI